MRARAGWRIALLLALAAGSVFVQAGGLHLEPGQGTNDVVVGKEPKQKAAPGPEGWRVTSDGLKYKQAKDGSVALIRCDQPQCATSQNVRVGLEASELWRRWGAPRDEQKAEGGLFYEYDGIGFLVQQGRIATIYVFPRHAR